MAERLTEKDSIDNKRYMLNSEENQITLTFARLDDGFSKSYYWGKAIDKLAQLEDILEKYGIESAKELDVRLDKTMLEWKNEVDKDFKDMIKSDRDTWQKACELACKHIAEVEWLSCPETDDISESENEIKTLTKQSLNYFCQQAKKEGNDEK